eukprot:jgi/Phyca11/21093/fgenesh1_pg.PHYCAscaffold_82_\
MSRLQFQGNKAHFAGWKDKFVDHLAAKSDDIAIFELQHNREKPLTRYEDLLKSQPTIPPLEGEQTPERVKAHELQEALVRGQKSYIKDLLNQTLPRNFADERLMREPVHVIWRAVEKRYGLNTASGVVELVQNFERVANSDFRNISHLFQQLKVAREQANRNSIEALGGKIISSHLMLVKVLAILPGHLWGSGIEFQPGDFTVEKVEHKLVAIFGNKSKAQIMALGKGVAVNHVQAGAAKPKPSALGKRKGAPVNDVHYNVGDKSCHYCAGEFNDMNDVGN